MAKKDSNTDPETSSAEDAAEVEAEIIIEAQGETITVKVSDAISSYGGAFYDPETRLTLGGQPVVTPKTHFVIEQLNAKHLIEV